MPLWLSDSRIGWHGAGTGAARAETERSPETVSSVKPRRPRVDASALLSDVAALTSEVDARGATGVSVIAVAGALFPSQASVISHGRRRSPVRELFATAQLLPGVLEQIIADDDERRDPPRAHADTSKLARWRRFTNNHS